jgi:hypothetical protein
VVRRQGRRVTARLSQVTCPFDDQAGAWPAGAGFSGFAFSSRWGRLRRGGKVAEPSSGLFRHPRGTLRPHAEAQAAGVVGVAVGHAGGACCGPLCFSARWAGSPCRIAARCPRLLPACTRCGADAPRSMRAIRCGSCPPCRGWRRILAPACATPPSAVFPSSTRAAWPRTGLYGRRSVAWPSTLSRLRGPEAGDTVPPLRGQHSGLAIPPAGAPESCGGR